MVNTQDGPDEPATPPDQTAEDRARKKKDKIRSAWISFVGRIIAQILGAVATITLGLALADRIRTSPAMAGEAGAASTAGVLSVASRAPTDSRPSLAVLPLDLFSPDPADQYLADSLTEEVVAALVDNAAVRVASRTSSRRYRSEPRSIPEIAAALRVDVVVEGSLAHEGGLLRVRLRAIDGASDTPLGTVVRESRASGLATERTGIASSAARELSEIVLARARR